jgi:hypothetical protein
MPDRARTLPLCVTLCLLAGCAPSDEPAATPVTRPSHALALKVANTDEVESLRAEVNRLAAENALLRLSPSALAAEVDAAVQAGDADRAKAALQRLADRFPYSAELGVASKRVEALVARERAAQEEARRLAAFGFKGLKVRPVFVSGDTALDIAGASVGRRWTFDSYGDGWRFLDAEKDKKYLVARMTVSSKSKDPPLFGVGAYVADGGRMTQVGNLRYRFVRWKDFGAYLGTHADFRNDFSHNSRIPFSAAVAITDEELKRRPIYLVVTREGCHRRNYERFGQPPVFYVPQACPSLKPVLTLEDFKDGSLAVLKRID